MLYSSKISTCCFFISSVYLLRLSFHSFSWCFFVCQVILVYIMGICWLCCESGLVSNAMKNVDFGLLCFRKQSVWLDSSGRFGPVILRVRIPYQFFENLCNTIWIFHFSGRSGTWVVIYPIVKFSKFLLCYLESDLHVYNLV